MMAIQIDDKKFNEAQHKNYLKLLNERDLIIVSLKSQLDVVAQMLADTQRKLLELTPAKGEEQAPDAPPAKNGEAAPQKEGTKR